MGVALFVDITLDGFRVDATLLDIIDSCFGKAGLFPHDKVAIYPAVYVADNESLITHFPLAERLLHLNGGVNLNISYHLDSKGRDRCELTEWDALFKLIIDYTPDLVCHNITIIARLADLICYNEVDRDVGLRLQNISICLHKQLKARETIARADSTSKPVFHFTGGIWQEASFRLCTPDD